MLTPVPIAYGMPNSDSIFPQRKQTINQNSFDIHLFFVPKSPRGRPNMICRCEMEYERTRNGATLIRLKITVPFTYLRPFSIFSRAENENEKITTFSLCIPLISTDAHTRQTPFLRLLPEIRTHFNRFFPFQFPASPPQHP